MQRRSPRASSRASASRGGRCRVRRSSFAPATASIATRTSISRSTLLLAQQPPLSKAFSVSTRRPTPLTLANGFIVPAIDAASNTFAVDPDLRVGEAQNWQALVQRDLPASLTVTATYLGTQGHATCCRSSCRTRIRPAPRIRVASCPSGFVYLTSNGSRRGTPVSFRCAGGCATA